MTLFQQNFEGGTNGTGITAANSGTSPNTAFGTPAATGGCTLTYSTAAAFHGSLGMAITYSGSGAAYAPWTTVAPVDANTRTVTRFYVNMPTGTTSQALAYFRNASANAGQVNIDSSGRFQILGTAATLATNSTTITGGTWYRVEAALTPGTTTTSGTFEITVYLGDTSTVHWTTTVSSANLGSAVLTAMRFGSSSNPAARAVYYDDIAVNDALASGLLGPSAASSTPAFTSTGSLTVFAAPTFSVAPSLSSTGTLTVGTTPNPTATPALSSTGTLAASAAVSENHSGTATLSSTGTLTSTGTPSGQAAPAFSSSGTLAASGAPTVAKTVALSSSGALTTSGSPTALPSVALSSSGALTSSGKPTLAPGIALSSSGALSYSFTFSEPVTLALSSSGTLAVAPVSSLPGTATLSSSGTLTASGLPRSSSAVGFSGSGTLAVTPSPVNYTPLVGFSASEVLTPNVSGLSLATPVTLAESGALVAAVLMGESVAPQFSSSGLLATAGKPTAFKSAAFSSSGTLTASVRASYYFMFSATGTLSSVFIHYDLGPFAILDMYRNPQSVTGGTIGRSILAAGRANRVIGFIGGPSAG